MNLSLLNSICYTLGWFWSVFWGIHDQPILAFLGATFLILLQLYLAKIKEVSLYIQDLLLAFFSLFLGICLEWIFIQSNLIYYVHSTKTFPPVWVIVLYPLFSLLLNHSLKIIKKTGAIAFFFGLLLAPLSYLAGLSLGGLTFSYSLINSWILIGTCWGLFLLLLIKIAKSIEKATKETLIDRNSKISLTLLYDGECPLCKREVCFLQKKKPKNTLKFVDISSKDFFNLEQRSIDYATAMSQIHAIDEKGNLLVGIDAFCAVYANCHLLVASTLLRLPFIKWILKPMYSQFAKRRLWLTRRGSAQIKK